MIIIYMNLRRGLGTKQMYRFLVDSDLSELSNLPLAAKNPLSLTTTSKTAGRVFPFLNQLLCAGQCVWVSQWRCSVPRITDASSEQLPLIGVFVARYANYHTLDTGEIVDFLPTTEGRERHRRKRGILCTREPSEIDLELCNPTRYKTVPH